MVFIRNATLIDGSENCRRFRANVLVRNGVITSIERIGEDVDSSTILLAANESILTIDASHLILCPGFIDMHAHSDLHLLSHPSHVPKLSQGITLEVIGQDGIGYAPLLDADRKADDEGLDSEQALEYVRKQIAGWNGDPEKAPGAAPFFTWRTTAEYLDTLDSHQLAVNVAVLVPQGNLRLLAIGPDFPPSSNSSSATPEQIKRMRQILRKSLDEGALGMSSGLTYVPGMYADYEELKALCEELVLARSDPRPGAPLFTPYYSPHHRSYGLNALAAYDEMLRLCLDTDVPIHLTHATLNFPPNAGKADELLAMIQEYEARGVDVSLDTYPYTAGSTTLAAMLPSWAAGGGVEVVMRRLRGHGETMVVLRDGEELKLEGQALLDAIREDVCIKGSDGCHGLSVDWDTLEIAGLGTSTANADPTLKGLVGKTVGDAARSSSSNLRDPFNLFVYILLTDSLSTSIIQHVGHEDNVRKMMRHHNHMLGTDALLAPSKCHPRAWGSIGRYLGWYARDIVKDAGEEWVGPDGRVEPPVSQTSPAPFEQKHTLEYLIPHLTSRPAKRLGLVWDPNQESKILLDVADTVRPRPRGLVMPGYAADLVLFNENTVRDRATFAEPAVQCAGIEWVLVNGVIAVENGQVTGARGGRTVRRHVGSGLVW